MLKHRNHDGVEYLDRGDYIEKSNGKQAYTYRNAKGRYFNHEGKRIYIKEENK